MVERWSDNSGREMRVEPNDNSHGCSFGSNDVCNILIVTMVIKLIIIIIIIGTILMIRGFNW